MNTKRYLIASLAVFAFIFIYEWVFHGMLLKPIYEQTSHLWRPPEECVTWAMLGGQLIFPFILARIFLKGYENKGLAEGARFGLLIGLLFVPGNLIFYAVQPLPLNLVLYWSVGGIIEMTGCGLILAALFRPLPTTQSKQL